VTGLAAELGCLHDLHTLVGRDCQDDDVDGAEQHEAEDPPPGSIDVQVDDGEGRGRVALLLRPAGPPPFAGYPHGDQDQSAEEDRRKDEVSQDPHVGIAVVAEQLDAEQRDDQDGACRRDRGTDEADRAPRQGDEEAAHVRSG
jgi:hypothetical protein